ncbi:LPD28 domain-containing protein [Bacteroides oleiciplenus]|uniref:Large polyvalent protein associated domain-containing protein n=1 Tax=Bacteroides oleiciplenus YIT 12058 TaxID=742727 RepID=K9DV21_9BACE|nr:LPD28 domain-containing protein [Bacteroides oleiciplenus]EKU88764.1 hypothetical protein HMPREF9447_04082 [Bacteroides oleiciplenus YIT 12058]
MSPKNINEIDDFQLIELDIHNQKAIPAIFTDYRVNRSTLPEGLFAYDIRAGETKDFDTIELNVLVNHTGTVIVKHEIPMTDSDYTPIEDYNFIGSIELNEFLT